MLLGLQYVHILLLFDGLMRPQGFLTQLDTWELISLMITEYWEQSFVTVRSRVIAAVAIVAWIVLLVLGRRNPRDEMILFVIPVVLTYLIVVVVSGIIGSAFYKNYVALQLSPFVVMFVLTTCFRARIKTVVSIIVVGLFLAANVGSIPIFERFPDKPSHMQDVKTFVPHRP